MIRAALLTLCCVLVCHAKEANIKFISGPEVITDLGKSVSLVCKVENGKAYPIVWMKKNGDGDTLPLSTGRNLIMKNTAKYNLSYEEVGEEIILTLEITKVAEQDSALYLCEVMVGINQKVTEQVELKVRTPVRLEDSSTQELTVVEGQRATLDCVTRGFPAPRLQWTRRDGGVMAHGKQASSGQSLEFASVERTDRGEYVCEASNNVGPTVNMTAKLIVRFGPKVSAVRPRVVQALGYDVMLQCEVASFPTSAIDWSFRDFLIENEDRFRVTHFNTGPTSTRTTLKISGLKEEDLGSYQCVASNSHGKHQTTVELDKTRIPIPEAAYGGSEQAANSVLSLAACLVTFLVSIIIY